MISEWWLEPHLPAGGETFIDVGANRGEWSAALAERFRRVYAVEPNPDLLPGLAATMPANVEVLPVGAWSSARYVEFTKYERDVHLSAEFAHGGINTGAPTGYRRMWCQTLDSMPIEGWVDLVKIDVEGAELEVLRGGRMIIQRDALAEIVKGAEETIEHDRPLVIVEVHTGDGRVRDLMASWGYRLTVVRHPDYTEGDELWERHYWLVCEPQ